MQISEEVAKNNGLKPRQVDAVLSLSSEGATVPFMARYRKERTGGLDEVQIQKILDDYDAIKTFQARRELIIKTIDEQGLLGADLLDKINACSDLNELEDVYLPFKPKRKTRAEKARQLGLEGLAKIIMSQHEGDPEKSAQKFVKDKVSSIQEALSGAKDIIAEWINEDGWTRKTARTQFEKYAEITSKLVKSKKEEAVKYTQYFDWNESLKKCPSHRYLAMMRGESEGLLRVSVHVDNAKLMDRLEQRWMKSWNASSMLVKEALHDACKRLLLPSIENELRTIHKDKADADAIKVFANNLRQLLLQPPVGQKRTLAIDPGFRTGCKVVCLSDTGDLLYNGTIFPHPPQKERSQAQKKLSTLVEQYKIDVIAIGNGTAGRETEQLVKHTKFNRKVLVYVVDESGASIYSASSVGREEFGQYDVTVRGAVSIGRRLMDPLAELVKIDPKSIGVGQYQHDVDQKKLNLSLEREVESVVNSVGVDINTASKYLLQRVSGLGPQLADNIVSYRQEIGAYTDRAQLKKVPRLGAKAFEQCAGFLRIREGKNPLDNSAVHPEAYPLVKSMCRKINLPLEDAIGNEDVWKQVNLNDFISEETGLPTLEDILDELKKPGRDPRRYLGVLEFDDSIKTINDLREGMELPGLISNVTNFGAFVDIGIKENGLVHISELRDEYVSNPADVVKVYDKVRVKVKSVDLERKRIQLSMRL